MASRFACGRVPFFCVAKRKEPKKRPPLVCRPSAPLRCSPPAAGLELALAGHTRRGLLRSSDNQPLFPSAGCASRRHTRGSPVRARGLPPFSAADLVCAGGEEAEPCPSSAARHVLCALPGRVGGAPARARQIGNPQGR